MRAATGQRRVAIIRRLRDEDGLTFKAIARRLGLATSTVFDYYNDPDGSRADARKSLNHGVCMDCGGPTKNGGSTSCPARCRKCRAAWDHTIERRREQSLANRGKQVWTDDEILDAVRACAVDGIATTRGYADMYAAATEPVPSLPTVSLRFGLWANAVAAAGLRCSRNTSGPYSTRITREGCLLAIEECMHELGEPPTHAMYEAWAATTGAPSAALVRQRCGTWMQAIEDVLSEQAAA